MFYNLELIVPNIISCHFSYEDNDDINKFMFPKNRTKSKVQPSKLCNGKYMIPSTQITNTEIFVFIAVRIFKLFSRKVLFINKKDNGNC